jgi:mRNA-degrading endonuclease HigB of HigAB toxin-antitoxin module
MRFTLVLTLFLVVSLQSFGQLFQRTYGASGKSESAVAVEPLDDGYLLFISGSPYGHLMKIDLNGDSVSAYPIRVDTVNYSNTSVGDMIRLPNGNFLLSGSYYNPNNVKTSMYLMEITANGEQVNLEKFEFFDAWESQSVSEFRVYQDTLIMGIGSYSDGFRTYGHIILTNQHGEEVRTYLPNDKSGFTSETSVSATTVGDTAFYAVGTYYTSSSNRPILYGYEDGEAQTWYHIYPYWQGEIYGRDVIQYSDSSLLFTMSNDTLTILAEVSFEGDTIKTTKISGKGITHLRRNEAGNIIATGVYPGPLYGKGNSILFAELNEDLSFKWETKIGGIQQDYSYQIKETESGYVLAGYSASFNGNDLANQVYVVVTDKQGNTTSNDLEQVELYRLNSEDGFTPDFCEEETITLNGAYIGDFESFEIAWGGVSKTTFEDTLSVIRQLTIEELPSFEVVPPLNFFHEISNATLILYPTGRMDLADSMDYFNIRETQSPTFGFYHESGFCVGDEMLLTPVKGNAWRIVYYVNGDSTASFTNNSLSSVTHGFSENDTVTAVAEYYAGTCFSHYWDTLTLYPSYEPLKASRGLSISFPNDKDEWCEGESFYMQVNRDSEINLVDPLVERFVNGTSWGTTEYADSLLGWNLTDTSELSFVITSKGCFENEYDTTNILTAKIIPIPVPWIDPRGRNNYCETATINVRVNTNPGDYSVRWFKNDTIIEGEDSTALRVTEEGIYDYELYDETCSRRSSDFEPYIFEKPLIILPDTIKACLADTSVTLYTESYIGNFDTWSMPSSWMNDYLEFPRKDTTRLEITDEMRQGGLVQIRASAINTKCPTDYEYTYLKIEDCGLVGINESVAENIIRFNNPVFDQLQIQSESEIKTIRLMDLNGRTIWQGHVNSMDFDLDLSTTPAGIYYLILKTGHGIIGSRFLKE